MAQQPFSRRTSWLRVRRPGWWAVLVAVWVGAVAWATPSAQQRSGAAATPPASASAQATAATAAPVDTRALVNTYCVSCHNQRTKSAGLALDATELTDIPAHADVWEKVVRKVRAGMMPPPGMPRPDGPCARALVTSLEAPLDRAARTVPNPGRPLVHRLNRAEYANAVRDLLDARGGRQRDAAARRLERRVRQQRRRAGRLAGAARKLPDRGRARQCAGHRRHAHPAGRGGLPRAPGCVAGPSRRGDAARDGGRHVDSPTLPLDGEYQFQVRLFRTNLGTMRGLEYPHQLEISVDGGPRAPGGFRREQGDPASSENPTTTGDEIDGRFTVRVPLTAGPHAIRRRVPREDTRAQFAPPAVLHPQLADTIDFSGYPHIDQILRDRAVQPDRRGRHAQPAPDLRVPPASAPARKTACARRILSPLARRAYRGRHHAADLTGRDASSSRAAARKAAVRRRHRPRRCAGFWPARSSSSALSAIRRRWRPGAVYRLSDLELASRLSFFLWSSLPDDELLAWRPRGGCRRRRCWSSRCAGCWPDPKSQALVENFVGQWLQLRNLRNKQPNSHEFPDFDDNLRRRC